LLANNLLACQSKLLKNNLLACDFYAAYTNFSNLKWGPGLQTENSYITRKCHIFYSKTSLYIPRIILHCSKATTKMSTLITSANAELTPSRCHNILLFSMRFPLSIMQFQASNKKTIYIYIYIYIIPVLRIHFDWNTHVSSQETLARENYNALISLKTDAVKKMIIFN
jgi:hypothetical protein